ncbi:hypothetical protein MOBT1_002828 [Malassezia obtusa]|uniref:Mitochondrial adapter protein MCP1 transmembrane domain-containing protein n=1 Tax=Malassezia obtusa TaxID=76774 RepID=A0AAF0E2M8_9BASI|nr:hypothetical protein MOBT1_002828 [Malassezia obtusa]
MSGGERRWRARLLSVATAVQTGTAATLGSVLVTHLAAPVVAALVGPEQLDLANQTMLLGRVYYQNALLEPVVVWGALTAHLVASAVRRALLPRGGSWDVRRWSWAQWQSAAGYVLVPALLTHVWVNRVAPSASAPPVAGLSPSELDMSYVAYGFHVPRYVARSVALYAVLIAATALHWIGGAPKMSQRITRKRVRPHTALAAASVLAGVLALGTAAVARSGVAGLAPRMLHRFDAAYAGVWLYR